MFIACGSFWAASKVPCIELEAFCLPFCAALTPAPAHSLFTERRIFSRQRLPARPDCSVHNSLSLDPLILLDRLGQILGFDRLGFSLFAVETAGNNCHLVRFHVLAFLSVFLEFLAFLSVILLFVFILYVTGAALWYGFPISWTQPIGGCLCFYFFLCLEPRRWHMYYSIEEHHAYTLSVSSRYTSVDAHFILWWNLESRRWQ